jgi:RNA polymerase sigma-70 factor (ECF subfamily)
MANWHRDNSRKPVVSLDATVLRNVVEPQPESVAELEYDVRLLRDVIRTLDSARQELLVLKFTEGLTNREIGTIMGRSEGAIKSLYHRTLVELREKMTEKGLGVE